MKQIEKYETPVMEVVEQLCEGVLCVSVVGTTENYNVHEETDW